MILVYTAGHIRGLHYDVATGWLDEVREGVADNVGLISPMRAKEYLKGTVILDGTYENDLLANSKAIIARGKWDIRRCDVLLANLDLVPDKISIGTICEITLAYELRKPVIIIMSDPDNNVNNHPFVTLEASWIVKDIQEAIDVLNALV
jgi:nucleoside 2-deoxyribosyltransferase